MEDTRQSVQIGLSRMLKSAFTGKINTHDELIKHFGITEVIEKLSPQVRGKVLVTCNGGGDPERASKMNAAIVASTIASMLEDKLVTADDICKEISTDHMVEVLPHRELYRFLFDKLFSDKKFMQEILEIILQERLLGDSTASNFMKAVGDDHVIHEGTPPILLALCQLEMLKLNRDGKTFTDGDLLQIYTPEALVEYVAPLHLFAAVEAVAKLNDWLEKKPGLPEGVVTASEFPPAPGESSPPPLHKKEKEKKSKKRNSSAPDDEPEVTATPAAGDEGELTLDIDEDDADGTAAAQS